QRGDEQAQPPVDHQREGPAPERRDGARALRGQAEGGALDVPLLDRGAVHPGAEVLAIDHTPNHSSRAWTSGAAAEVPRAAAQRLGAPEFRPPAGRRSSPGDAPRGQTAQRAPQGADGGDVFNSPSEVVKYIEEEDVEFIDIRFCDLPGVMQHFNIPASTFDEEAIETGQLFDGSSIRGFQAIHESDMQLIPDLETAYLDPFRERTTLIINFSIVDPCTDEPYSRDPRTVATKAEEYLKTTGIADTAIFAAEAEFYIFDDVRFKTGVNSGFYSIDSDEAVWNTDRDESEYGGNQGYKTRLKGGYFPVPPNDQMADLRDEICAVLEETGLQIERAHHEVGTAGQQEINYRFNTLLQAADDVMKFKYVVKNTVWDAGRTATFMPKPLFGDNG